jgi:four helix bundle protein
MITRFEELQAWQMARELTKRVYSITEKPGFARDYKFAGQIQSAALSVGSNIAEGFERGTKPEFIRFLMIAKGSCAEVRSQLYSALDVGYLDNESFTSLLDYAEQVGKIIGGLRMSIIRKGKNGK